MNIVHASVNERHSSTGDVMPAEAGIYLGVNTGPQHTLG